MQMSQEMSTSRPPGSEPALSARRRASSGLTPAEVDLLLELLSISTVTPLETRRPAMIEAAQHLFAAYAQDLGLRVLSHEPPAPAALEDACVPALVREAHAEMGEEFLACQPNLVLALGARRPLARTVAINVHIDTVGGGPRLRRDGARVWGRGAVDMKGPAVAVLAAIRHARALRPDLADRIAVIVQCVAGEEGGAMGVHGTRVVMQAGHAGCLTIFAEPSGGWYFDRSAATMTAAIEVSGDGSTDDSPAAAHNATLLLGHLGCHLATRLDAATRALDGRLCIAGLSTGTRHDRVYGTGRLLVNVAYPSASAGRRLGELLEAAFADALVSFSRDFAAIEVASRAAADARAVCRLRWLKRGLPVLANRSPRWEAVLAAAGLERAGEDSRARAITCDAIWGALKGTYSIVFGPGELERNGAHTDREFVDLQDLDAYAGTLARVLLGFDDHLASHRRSATA